MSSKVLAGLAALRRKQANGASGEVPQKAEMKPTRQHVPAPSVRDVRQPNTNAHEAKIKEETQKRVEEMIEEVKRDVTLIDGRALRRAPKAKRRRQGITISVSSEEYDLLIAYGREHGGNFSEWARRVLFRAMGHKIPARPREM